MTSRARCTRLAAALVVLPAAVGALGSCANVLGLDDYRGRDAGGVAASDGGAPPATGSGSGSGSGSAACTDGALQCDAAQPQQCSGGQWHDQGDACTYSCTVGTCSGECVPGEEKCSGNGVETCGADFTWGLAVACPANTPGCSGGRCGVCVAGAMQCADTASTQTCTSIGQWSPATGCPAAIPFCNGAGVCGACKTATDRCVDNASEVCDATGTWGAPSACTDACVAGGCTGVCTPGATQCSGTVPQTCTDMGVWTSNPIVSGTCSAICTPQQTQCSGTTPQICNSVGTGWLDLAVTAAQCGAVCNPGVTECVDTTHNTTCQPDGTWGPEVITPGICGAECTPGQKACLNSSQPNSFCTGPASCWWVWTTEAISDETCTSAGLWGPENLCTGECAGTNGMSYYNCDANNGGCIGQGVTCSQE